MLTSEERNNVLIQLHTISDYIRWATSYFNQSDIYFGHGTDNAIDEAAYLVLYALNLSNQVPVHYYSAKLLEHEKKQVIEIIFRRVDEGIPAAYLTHHAMFAGLEFYVDERVLVPRSPIAELIAQRFSPWVDENSVSAILDLCTGSGCIAIACAYAFPHAEIDAIDISDDALDVAEINLNKHTLNKHINLIQSDLFKALSEDSGPYQGKYDIIVSNPPYVDQEDMQGLPTEFQAEPELGLAAGEDGLSLVIPMLYEAKNYLSEQGIIIIEVGNSQYALMDKFPEVPFYWLEFEQGGDGVFLLTREQLEQYF